MIHEDELKEMNEYIANKSEDKMTLPMKGRLYHPKVDTNDELIDKVVYDGKVDDGSQYGLKFKLLETIDQKGNQLIGVYQNIGAVWVQDNPKAPNLFFKGNITIDKKDLDISIWKNKDEETGDEWVSVNVDEKYKKTEE